MKRSIQILKKCLWLSLLLVFITVGAAAVWLNWPTANTLVRQAEQDDTDGMEWSLSLGVDPNALQLWGWRHDCEGETALTSAARTNSEKAVRLLLKNGADPNIKNGWDHNPLCIAIRQGNFEICRLLIEHGADPNQSDSTGKAEYAGGWNALDWAAFLEHDKIMDYLKTNGAIETGRTMNAKIKPLSKYNH